MIHLAFFNVDGETWMYIWMPDRQAWCRVRA